jgi:cytoskeletal protein RodZ
MRVLQKSFRASLITASAVVALLITGCGTMEKLGLGGKKSVTAELTGAQEVPPVSTKASGKSTITVADDKSVSGSVIVDDMTPTAAHIHQGAAGANGPVSIPLTKTSDKKFSVPANTKLTDAQYAAYKGGNLYINVHSASHPGGEIRVQMKP